MPACDVMRYSCIGCIHAWWTDPTVGECTHDDAPRGQEIVRTREYETPCKEYSYGREARDARKTD